MCTCVCIHTPRKLLRLMDYRPFLLGRSSGGLLLRGIESWRRAPWGCPCASLMQRGWFSAWTEEGEIRCPSFEVLCNLVWDVLARNGRRDALVVLSGPTRRTTGPSLWRRTVASGHMPVERWCTLWHARHLPAWARRASRVAARRWLEREWAHRGRAGRLRLLLRFFR